MSAWKPIATAPTDGTEIVLANQSRAALCSHSQWDERDHPPLWLEWPYISGHPTHWQPKPEAPE